MKLIDLIKPFTHELTTFIMEINGDKKTIKALYVEGYPDDRLMYDIDGGEIIDSKIDNLPDYFSFQIVDCYAESVGLKAFIRGRLYGGEK